MNNNQLSLNTARKYRQSLARKLNRARFISRNKLLKIFFNLKPQEILDKAKKTQKYLSSKELVHTHRNAEKKPLPKLKDQTKRWLREILENSIEFIEQGKKYYMTMLKDTQSYHLDQKGNPIAPQKNYKETYWDVLLTNEYGVVIWKWDYNTLTSSYDSFVQLRWKTTPETIIFKINEQLMKFQKNW